MENLLGKNLQELRDAVSSCGLKPFVGKQLAEWIYGKRVLSWDGMTNISNSAKQALSARFLLGGVPPEDRAVSADGTVKYLFPVECEIAVGKSERSYIEAVMIPEQERRTLCVSSQAGCRMNCSFCMTGRGGWHGNLSASDIINQFLSIPESGELSNAVFMGMGEPLDNYDSVSRALEILTAPWGFAWSPKRITLSTIGILPVLKRFLDEQKCHLAVSLHNPFPEERLQMMPVQKVYNIAEIVRLLKTYDFTGQRRVSFEYTMFTGFNDDLRHADALARLLAGLECRVNLIRFHKIPDFPYGTSSEKVMEAFRDRLSSKGINCTIRASRGEDIFAACGLLAGKHQAK